MSHFKRLCAAILSAVMMFSVVSTSAFAVENEPKYVENGIEYITVHDDENNTVQAIQRDVATGECVYGPVISVPSASEIEQTPMPTVLGSDVHQDTFLNFEYDIWESDPREWNLERPTSIFNQAYFRCYQNSSNRSELNDFKEDVDALNAQEWVVIGGIGLTAYNTVKAYIESHAAIASGGILTVAAIDSIKDACASLGATSVAIGLLCTTYNNCAMSYKDALNATDNIHYE